MSNARLRHTVVPPLVAVIAAVVIPSGIAVPLAANAAVNDAGRPSAIAAPPRTTAIPRDPKTVFVEDFEHGTGTMPVMLDKYVGKAGERYTADPAWVDVRRCNGIIISGASSDIAGCGSNASIKSLAKVLGEVTGTDRESNHALSA